MENRATPPRAALRLPAALLLGGQVAYIGITQLHAGGPANDHHHIFHTYAETGIWGAVHLGQFGSMAMLLLGLIALAFALDTGVGATRAFARSGAAMAAVALALYGVLQAVDGVALKQAVGAWAAAPEVERAARFATAESIRWLEWGMRSYHDHALGLALLLLGAAVATTTIRLPRAVALPVGLSGLAYLAQGWIAGSEGFSSAQSLAIVVAWVLSLVWMSWLFVAALPEGKSASSAKAGPTVAGAV